MEIELKEGEQAPAKTGKGAVIMIQEVQGGMNILVNFLDENGESMGGVPDEANFVHAIAKAAPIIIGAISDDFRGAVKPDELRKDLLELAEMAETVAANAITMQFDDWWDEEARELGIDTEQIDSRKIAQLAWDAALNSKQEQSEWPPTHEKLAEFGVRITEMGPGDWIASAGEEGGAGFGNTREWALVSLCGSLAAQLKVQSAQPEPIAEFKEGEFWQSMDGFVYMVGEVPPGRNKIDHVLMSALKSNGNFTGHSYERKRTDTAGWCQVSAPPALPVFDGVNIDAAHGSAEFVGIESYGVDKPNAGFYIGSCSGSGGSGN